MTTSIKTSHKKYSECRLNCFKKKTSKRNHWNATQNMNENERHFFGWHFSCSHFICGSVKVVDKDICENILLVQTTLSNMRVDIFDPHHCMQQYNVLTKLIRHSDMNIFGDCLNDSNNRLDETNAVYKNNYVKLKFKIPLMIFYQQMRNLLNLYLKIYENTRSAVSPQEVTGLVLNILRSHPRKLQIY